MPLSASSAFDEAAQSLADARTLLIGQESSLAREFAGEQLAEINLLRAKGQLAEARSRIEPMIEQVRQPKDKRRAILPAALMMATRISLAEGRFEEAERTANQVLASYEKRARDPARSADVGEALLWLATAERGLGKTDLSLKNAARAEGALEAALGLPHPLTQQAASLKATPQ